jgi:phosphate transport system substrate-binding protein
MKAAFLAVALISLATAVPAAEITRPAIDPEVADYQRSDKMEGVLRAVGSSTLSNLLFRWGAEFHRLYPTIDLQITGGGSETAVPALLSGGAELGPMSRPMSDVEVERFRVKFGYLPTRLTVAMDAITVYVNKHNPLSRISFGSWMRCFPTPGSEVARRSAPGTRWD